MNRDVAGEPWDDANETAEQCQDRKNIFNLLTTTAGPYKHLYNSVPNGGAQLAWKRISDELDADTTAEYNDLAIRFGTANQAALGLGVTEYISKVNELGDDLIAKGGQATPELRIAVLMKGLHKSFKPLTSRLASTPGHTRLSR